MPVIFFLHAVYFFHFLLAYFVYHKSSGLYNDNFCLVKNYMQVIDVKTCVTFLYSFILSAKFLL